MCSAGLVLGGSPGGVPLVLREPHSFVGVVAATAYAPKTDGILL